MAKCFMPKLRPQPSEAKIAVKNQASAQTEARFLDLWQRNLAAWAESWPGLQPDALKPGGIPPQRQP